jgi:hypothetical protein
MKNPTLKMVQAHSSEMSVPFIKVYSILSQKTVMPTMAEINKVLELYNRNSFSSIQNVQMVHKPNIAGGIACK